MKYFYTATLFLFISIAQAQQDVIPISQNGLWIMGSGSFPIGEWVLDTPWRITISDTVNVNDTLYLQFSNFGTCSGDTTTIESFLLREDSGKYYHKNNIADPEQLWFDFTLDIDDTVALNWGNDTLELSVIAIDYVILQDGIQRRKWTLQYIDIPWTEQWIEGIGNVDFGWKLFGNGGTFDINMWLRCYYENNEWVGTFEDLGSNVDCCSLVGVSETDLHNLNLYPNPANNRLTIESPTEISMVEITDMMGRIIMLSEPHALRTTLNIDLMSEGCYFINVKWSNGKGITQKFVKQY